MATARTSQTYEKYLANPENVHKYTFKSEQVKNAVIHILKKYEEMPKACRHVLKRVPKWECALDTKGEFVLSQLKKEFLKVDAYLYFSSQGIMSFLSDYKELFPHHISEICKPLKLFVKLDASLNTRTILHLVDDYTELFISHEGFSIESQLQGSQSILTVKSKPDDTLAKRCFTLFALLNGSEIFKKLPDQEILIESISLLRENYTQNSDLQHQGVLISLVNSVDGFILKFLQSNDNRIMLKATSENDKLQLQFVGDVPVHPNTQKQLFKLISLFFTNLQDNKETAWRFACMEAVSQSVADSPLHLNFDLSISETFWQATFTANALGDHTIPVKSKQVLGSGADKVDISPNGREIRLMKNPPEGIEANISLLHRELDDLHESAVLAEVNDTKAREADKRKIKMEEKYLQAIDESVRIYESKRIPVEKDEKSLGKTLEKAAVVKMIQSQTKIRTTVIRVKIAIMAAIIGFITLSLVGFVYLMSSSSATSSPGIYLKEINPKQVPQISQKDHGVQATQFDLLPDPAQKLVAEICISINVEDPLSQEEINQMLAKLHRSDPAMRESGDFYNIQARLYWYKIILDIRGEKLFSDLTGYEDLNLFTVDWIENWKKAARLAFDQAIEKYKQNKYRSSLNIAINSWKPEQYLYPETSGSVALQLKHVSYKSNQDAIVDIEQCKKHVSTIKHHIRKN